MYCIVLIDDEISHLVFMGVWVEFGSSSIIFSLLNLALVLHVCDRWRNEVIVLFMYQLFVPLRKSVPVLSVISVFVW